MQIKIIGKELEKLKKILLSGSLAFCALFLSSHGFSQEDRVVQTAIATIKAQARLPQGTQVKFLEKKESPIPDFYAVKLFLLTPDKEIPVVVYVDKAAEKVFLGNLYIKGVNVTAKEAGPAILKKVDMSSLEVEKSPSLGPKEAKVTIVEFANFECSHCQDSWAILRSLIKKYPADLRYVFKHFPFQPQGKAFELSEMAAAVQEVNNEAFWAVHDFLFSEEGHTYAAVGKETLKQRIEAILEEKGYDVKAFRSALETGRGKKRVEEDMAVGNRIPVSGTPTKVINGDVILGSTQDGILEKYLKN
jgi:protein-disulfide isomerase